MGERSDAWKATYWERRYNEQRRTLHSLEAEIARLRVVEAVAVEVVREWEERGDGRVRDRVTQELRVAVGWPQGLPPSARPGPEPAKQPDPLPRPGAVYEDLVNGATFTVGHYDADRGMIVGERSDFGRWMVLASAFDTHYKPLG